MPITARQLEELQGDAALPSPCRLFNAAIFIAEPILLQQYRAKIYKMGALDLSAAARRAATAAIEMRGDADA